MRGTPISGFGRHIRLIQRILNGRTIVRGVPWMIWLVVSATRAGAPSDYAKGRAVLPCVRHRRDRERHTHRGDNRHFLDARRRVAMLTEGGTAPDQALG